MRTPDDSRARCGGSKARGVRCRRRRRSRSRSRCSRACRTTSRSSASRRSRRASCTPSAARGAPPRLQPALPALLPWLALRDGSFLSLPDGEVHRRGDLRLVGHVAAGVLRARAELGRHRASNVIGARPRTASKSSTCYRGSQRRRARRDGWLAGHEAAVPAGCCGQLHAGRERNDVFRSHQVLLAPGRQPAVRSAHARGGHAPAAPRTEASTTTGTRR